MGIVDEVIENAVHEGIERFFEDGNVPSGLAKTIKNLIETAVEHAVEKKATASGMPASNGSSRTSRERPRTSRPTGRDDEGNEDWRPHELIWINDTNSKSSVFHHESCRHVVSTTSSYTKCKKCPRPASSRDWRKEDEQAEVIPEFVLVNNNCKLGVYHEPGCGWVSPCPRTYRRCDQCLKHWPSR